MAYTPPNPHWSAVRGFFDFEDVYRLLVKRAQEGDTLVEIGCLLGRSACYLGDQIKESGKALTLLAVDPWPTQFDFGNGDIIEAPFETFVANIRQAGLVKIIVPLRCESLRAARFVANNLSAVFIDGDHSYESCRDDIAAWLPKVRSGGILAGHDYNDKDFPGVVKAAREAFGDKLHFMGQSWIYDVP
jgi:predicted O-methyltransferase YrrM